MARRRFDSADAGADGRRAGRAAGNAGARPGDRRHGDGGALRVRRVRRPVPSGGVRVKPIDWLIGAVLVLWVMGAFIVPAGALAHLLLVVVAILIYARVKQGREDAS